MKIKNISLKLSIVIILALITFMQFLPQNTIKVDASFETDKCKSYILIEASTNKILVSKNENEHLPIASVTKLMTVLLTLEEIENNNLNLTDTTTVSENANKMGGSQIFLDANTNYEIGNLLKSVIVSSANDSSVALAEHIAGSENNFVKLMNEKAIELGMNNTHYSNCTGLPTDDAYSCSLDQAILLNKVLNYETYQNYSHTWMEDFLHPSGRKTMMTNTNKLIKFYDGCLGGKTGFTNQAKHCLAVGAKRNGVKLISVVLGAESSSERFKISSELLNYGFANFNSTTIFDNSNLTNKTISIKGTDKTATLKAERNYTIVLDKNQEPNFQLNYNLPDTLTSITENEIVGNVEIVVDGVLVDTINILSASTIEEPSLWDYIKEITQM